MPDDRERAYLNDPESVEGQERAAIRYRIRAKYAGTIDGLRTFPDAPELWDKKERAGEAEVATRRFPRYEYAKTGHEASRFDDWRDVNRKTGGHSPPS